MYSGFANTNCPYVSRFNKSYIKRSLWVVEHTVQIAGGHPPCASSADNNKMLNRLIGHS